MITNDTVINTAQFLSAFTKLGAYVWLEDNEGAALSVCIDNKELELYCDISFRENGFSVYAERLGKELLLDADDDCKEHIQEVVNFINEEGK